MYNNSCTGNLPNVNDDHDRLGESCYAYGPKADKEYGGYEDALFAQLVVKTVEEHDVSRPYFLYWAPHIVHSPMQVPAQFFNKFNHLNSTDKLTHERQTYAAMVDFADAAIGNLTDALKRRGMWSDTLLIFSADNGGPVYFAGVSGGNNYPLKGGKMGNWDGGIRVNAFVSGKDCPDGGCDFDGFRCHLRQ